MTDQSLMSSPLLDFLLEDGMHAVFAKHILPRLGPWAVNALMSTSRFVSHVMNHILALHLSSSTIRAWLAAITPLNETRIDERIHSFCCDWVWTNHGICSGLMVNFDKKAIKCNAVLRLKSHGVTCKEAGNHYHSFTEVAFFPQMTGAVEKFLCSRILYEDHWISKCPLTLEETLALYPSARVTQ
jgi:hypothetical protein